MARLFPVNNGLVNELAHVGAPEQTAGVRHGIESALPATAGLPAGLEGERVLGVGDVVH